MQAIASTLLALGTAILILAWYRYWARRVSWDPGQWDKESPSDWREATVAADLRALFALERRRQNVLFGYQLWLNTLRLGMVQFVVTGSVAGLIIHLLITTEASPMASTLAVGLLLAGTVIFISALVRTDRRFKAAVRRLDGEIAEQRRRVAGA